MEILHNTNGVVTKKLTYGDGGNAPMSPPSAYAPDRRYEYDGGITPARWLEAETADIPEMYRVEP